jgi:hypothetical protein
MFGNAAPGALPWVTAFASSPGDATRGEWCGWPVRRDRDVPRMLNMNTYCTVSTFVAVEGGWRRRKAQFSALHCVMVDDIGVKVAESAIASPFTLEVETSPGNRQGWYRIDPPVTDRALAERLIERMVAAGLTSDGKDPGMKGVTRYGRLPVGSNNKPSVVTRCGGPWRHLVTEYRPHLAYTIEEIADAYELDLTSPAPRVFAARSAPSDECASVLDWLRAAGLHQQALGGGWHAITCPWAHEHTGGVISGTGYSEPGPDNNFAGGFKCHHGHCEHRGIGHLLRFIELLADRMRRGKREHA